MEWYYSEGGERRGPVAEGELTELVRQGRVGGDTLVWHTGRADWVPYRELPNPPAPLPTSLAGGTPPALDLERVCVECGGQFAAEDLVVVAGRRVCAACKSLHLQRLKEGAPLTGKAASHGMFQDGKDLIVEIGAVPPDLCMHCNAPATWRKSRKFLWNPPWVWVFILCNILVLLIVAYVTRKTMAFDVVLCDAHQVRRRKGILAAWGVTAAVVVAVVGVFLSSDDSAVRMVFFVVGVIVALFALLFGARSASVLTPVKIGPRGGRFRRASAEYRAALPKWPGGEL